MTNRPDDQAKESAKADAEVFHEGGRTGFLLIHGLSGTPGELRYISNGLARAGHTVSCPQLAGHGLSIDDLRVATWRDWEAGMQAALDRLAERCDHVFVGGLSMGAILALRLAHQNPNTVNGTLLYAPTIWLDGWGA